MSDNKNAQSKPATDADLSKVAGGKKLQDAEVGGIAGGKLSDDDAGGIAGGALKDESLDGVAGGMMPPKPRDL